MVSPTREMPVYLGKVNADHRDYKDETARLDTDYFYYVIAHVKGDTLDPSYTLPVDGFHEGRSVRTPKLSYLPGDVNGDGKITIDDVLMIQKFLAKMITLDPCSARRPTSTATAISL